MNCPEWCLSEPILSEMLLCLSCQVTAPDGCGGNKRGPCVPESPRLQENALKCTIIGLFKAFANTGEATERGGEGEREKAWKP